MGVVVVIVVRFLRCTLQPADELECFSRKWLSGDSLGQRRRRVDIVTRLGLGRRRTRRISVVVMHRETLSRKCDAADSTT